MSVITTVRTSIQLAIGLSIVILLSSCAGIDQKSSSTNSFTDAENKQIQLTLWHDWTGQDSLSVAMRELIEEFQGDNPHIELRSQGIPRDVYRSRIKTMAAADELPDTFLIWPDSMTREFVQGEMIQPIDELLQSDVVWSNSFVPNSFDAFTVNEHIYSAPMTMAPASFVFYNEALFRKYGLTFPQNWDELMHTIQVFNSKGIIPIALGNKNAWVAQSSIFSTLADRMTGSEWFMNAISQDGTKFNDPIFIDALRLMQELVNVHAFQENFNQIDHVQMEQLFYNKQAAMFVEGSWAVSSLIVEAPQDVLDSTRIGLLPTVPGGKGNPQSTSGVVGTGIAINKKLSGEQKEAAFKLLYALSGPDAQRKILNSNTLISYQLELDHSIAHPLFIDLHELVKEISISPAYETQLTTAAVETLNESISLLLKGEDPLEAANRIESSQVKALGKLR